MIKNELPIIQKTYDLIQWYVPIIDRLPKYHRVTLGDRITSRLYDLLEELIAVRFTKEGKLQKLNSQLQVLRYQPRLLKDFQLIARCS